MRAPSGTKRVVLTGLPFAFVVAALLAAVVFLLAYPGHWHVGTLIMASAMLVAGLLRLTLPAGAAGMLVVRKRAWDVVCYLALGGVILAVDIRVR